MLKFLSKNATNNKAEEALSTFTVSVAESVTAGALSVSLCSEPGSSSYFRGGVTTYSTETNKDILGIDISRIEDHNYANPFTTYEMAKAVVAMFKSRIGIATTGYSLPIDRKNNSERGEYELKIDYPYAYICLYDSLLDQQIIIKKEYPYDDKKPRDIQRAAVQTKVALEGKKLYLRYIATCMRCTEANQ